MLVYRLCSRRYPANDGLGATLYGGRWNRKGTPVIYAEQAAPSAPSRFLRMRMSWRAIPYGKGKRWGASAPGIADAALGGWEVSTLVAGFGQITSTQSGNQLLNPTVANNNGERHIWLGARFQF